MDYASLTIVEALPSAAHRPEGGEDILRSMAGATIVKIGSVDAEAIEGGGLLIDYVSRGQTQTHRIVLGIIYLTPSIFSDTI